LLSKHKGGKSKKAEEAEDEVPGMTMLQNARIQDVFYLRLIHGRINEDRLQCSHGGVFSRRI
jgi:hypothetical protein